MRTGGETESAVRPPGRPRLYEPEAERDRILAGALEVLHRNDGQEPTVAEILEASGLSTRAFYRHFQTKEDVIRALYRRDNESFGRHLQRRVAAAPDPRQGLEVWICEALALGYDRRRAERVATLKSPMVERAIAGTDERQLGLAVLLAPLRSVLERGLADGSFPRAQPETDVPLIGSLVWEALGWAGGGCVTQSRRQAVDQVLRFALPALGWPPPGAAG